MTIDVQVIDTVQRWLDAGLFDSTVDQWIDGLKKDTNSWYGLALRREGTETADAELLEHLTEGKNRIVADALPAVARSVLSLASMAPIARHENLHIRMGKPREFSGDPWSYRSQELEVVTLMNLGVPGCGCQQPAGAPLFMPEGLLGMLAIVLTAIPHEPHSGKLYIVMQDRRIAASGWGHTVAEFDTAGRLRAYSSHYAFLQTGPLQWSLGISDSKDMWTCASGGGGNPDRTFGPGCSDLLRRSLPNLAEYLVGVKAALSGEHSH